MRPAENVKKLIKNARITIDPEIKLSALNELINELKKHKTTVSAISKPAIWRMIMKSPMTKLAIAASAIVTFTIGLSLWTGTQSGIALADVLTRIEQVTGYTYQLKSTTTKQQLTGSRTSSPSRRNPCIST